MSHLTNQQVFRKKLFHYWKNVFAGRIWPAGRRLEQECTQGRI